ncbi:hypothetical protein [Mycobacterium sp. RTGN5]|uniref:hypothetical protein n=1 Tax=Mycobacterium sp. RTGN5 TaxID=3016522 RepID=UPI0029C95128|nr:hypothetical protein [Mycobacterium sp. RTGN5]
MQHAARRPMFAIAAMTTIGALALTPIAGAPPALHAPSLSAARISTQAVALTDAWSDLFADTAGSLTYLGGVFLGADNNFPLPNPTIPLAPVTTQLVLNPLIYAVQLITGKGGQIPGEISTHLTNVVNLAKQLATDLPPAVVQQILTPFLAAREALDSITAGNLLTGLFEAPAIFLNLALNSQYGLLGATGPIAVPIIIRNLLATAISTPLPTVVLPFKKPAAAESTPKAAVATVAPKSVTASSAPSKPKAPASSRKTAAAKANNSAAGAGHSKRK